MAAAPSFTVQFMICSILGHAGQKYAYAYNQQSVPALLEEIGGNVTCLPHGHAMDGGDRFVDGAVDFGLGGGAAEGEGYGGGGEGVGEAHGNKAGASLGFC